MPNRPIANEWLELSKHNFEAAVILFKEQHYNDVIAIELHQSIEKSLKAVLAFQNKTIIKTHDLLVLLNCAEEFVSFDSDLKTILDKTTDYYVDNNYPGGGINFMPSNEEIEKLIETAKFIYNRVFEYVNEPVSF